MHNRQAVSTRVSMAQIRCLELVILNNINNIIINKYKIFIILYYLVLYITKYYL